jgi:hypothetical protein
VYFVMCLCYYQRCLITICVTTIMLVRYRQTLSSNRALMAVIE